MIEHVTVAKYLQQQHSGGLAGGTLLDCLKEDSEQEYDESVVTVTEKSSSDNSFTGE
jgi:hypothetical protein